MRIPCCCVIPCPVPKIMNKPLGCFGGTLSTPKLGLGGPEVHMRTRTGPFSGSHNFQLCSSVSLQGLGHGAGEDTSLTPAPHKAARCCTHTAEGHVANASQPEVCFHVRSILYMLLSAYKSVCPLSVEEQIVMWVNINVPRHPHSLTRKLGSTKEHTGRVKLKGC